ncbi:hypothetical protein Tco_0133105 [Tanacetum coccineum]
MTPFDYRLNPIYAIKECSSCGSLYTSNCGCSKGSLEDKILVPIPDSSQRSFKIEKFCLNCGDPIHGFHCQRCALIQKTFEEVLQDFQDTSESSDDNTNVVNAPREPIVVNQDPGENSSPSPLHIDHCCHECVDSLEMNLLSTMHFPPQVQFCPNNQDPCFNQNFDYFPQTSPSFPQQYLCCENCGGPHETYQCQPTNEDYYHEQNSCYDSNSFGFDQVQPPQYTVNHPIFNSQNELLNSQNKLMEQMTTLRDLVDQVIQKKEEEKRIAEEQAAKDRSWKIPICYDDDEDNTIAITPVLPIEEPDNSLSMGDEHLDTIPETESDEFIKSSVEDLVPIPSESEGIPDKMCDVPLCNNPTPLNALNEHSEIVVNSNDDNSSSDDDSPYGENIDYVDALSPDVEIVSLEVVEIVDPEVGRIDDDILLTIKDDILREKLLNVNLLIAKIDSLRDNPTPSSEVVIKSTSTFPNLFLEETNTFDNSIPESETFRFNLEEIRSDFNHEEFADELTHIMPLPELECFKFKIEPDPGDLTSIDLGIRKNVSTTNVNVPLEDDQSSLFAYVVWIFLAFLTYPVVPPYLLSTRNEDTIFDPGISMYHSFMPDVSHRSGTFMKFNDFPDCEDSRACSIHMSFTSSASVWESSIQI